MIATGQHEITAAKPETLIERDLHALQYAIENSAGSTEQRVDSLDASYTELLDYLGNGVYRMTPGGRLLFANRPFLQMLGYSSMGEAEKVRFGREQFFTTVAAVSSVRSVETCWLRKDGTAVSVVESARVVKGADGSIAYVEGVVQDVTNERRLAVLDRDHRKILDMMSANFSLDVIMGEIAGMLERQIVNARVTVRLGRSAHVFVAPESRALPVDMPRHCPEASREVLGGVCQVLTCPARCDGQHAFRGSWSAFIHTSSGTRLGEIVVYHCEPRRPESSDVKLLQTATGLAAVAVQSRRMFDDLSRQANSDRATHLPNRYALAERLAQTLQGKTKAAVLWVGMDRLSGITEAVGCRTGDHLLRCLGNRINGVLEGGEWLACVGSDEFAVVCDGADRKAAEACAQRILHTLEMPFRLKNFSFFVNAHIGIATYPDDGATPALLEQNAIAACLRARSQATIKYSFYERQVSSNLRDRLELEHDLRRAVQRREFRLYYQPQMNLDQKLIGMEALIRWNHPVRGILAPAQFIQIAEETGLIVQIGTWVIQEACRQCAEWHRTTGLPVKVAVNVSAMQFYFSDLPEIVRASLAETGLPAECFEIELTETVIMRNAEDSAKALDRLRALGVTVAIDDFGTGYSSLSYLQKLPVDLLKIDRSFLQQIHVASTAAVVQAITALAHSLGLRVAAEGIETEAQMDVVRKFGVDFAQGFLFGRPVPPEEAEKWISGPVATPASDALDRSLTAAI